MKAKQPTLRELEGAAKSDGKPRIRMEFTVVWPDGDRVTWTTTKPQTVESAIEGALVALNPSLDLHHGKRGKLVAVRRRKA